MIREVNAVDFRQNLGEMITRVQYQNDSVLIKKSGKPVAALIDAELFLRIRAMRERFDILTDILVDAYKDIPESDFEDEVLDIISKERKKESKA